MMWRPSVQDQSSGDWRLADAATVPVMDIDPKGTVAPEDSAEPDEVRIGGAKMFAATALSETGRWPVSQRLGDYYELRGNYAGSTFTHLQERHPSSTDPRCVTVADLHAVSLLSVRVPPAATRALIDNIDGHATKVDAALAALDGLGVRHLRDAGPDVLAAMENVANALMAACRNKCTKGVSNP